MAPKYEKGQKVVIVPVTNKHVSLRNSELEPYAGQSGTITDYYWINRGTEVFYIYTVRIGDSHNEVVLHEDELEAYIA